MRANCRQWNCHSSFVSIHCHFLWAINKNYYAQISVNACKVDIKGVTVEKGRKSCGKWVKKGLHCCQKVFEWRWWKMQQGSDILWVKWNETEVASTEHVLLAQTPPHTHTHTDTHTTHTPCWFDNKSEKKGRNGKPRHSYKNGCNEFL